VFDGQNGAGTPSLLCRPCGRKASVWNTYELSVWRYKKTLAAMLYSVYGGSIRSSSNLLGVGEGVLREVAMGLPEVRYSRNGELEVIEYGGERFGVVTIDMMYKGRKGVMLAVCGGMSATALGSENTGEGLEGFFDEVERRVPTERYLFVMDMRMNVARMILDRWGERAVIVLQSHTIWGDVQVYFHRNGWHTLHIRTDAFSEASKKRDEAELLGIGEMELYSGLKGTSARVSLKDTSEDWLRGRAEELTLRVRNADWEAEGRVDLVMRPKLAKLNSVFEEMERRGMVTEDPIRSVRAVIEGLIERYARSVRRVMKQKVVNSWSALATMRADVERLSEALLKEALPARRQDDMPEELSGGEAEGGLRVRIFERARLVYRGRMDDASVPEEGRWIIGLLRATFGGKEITTNECEGRFGVIGMEFRRGRSMYAERAVTRVHLQGQEVSWTADWLMGSYPIQEMGRRGRRGMRRHLRKGGQYRIMYRDWRGVQTDRVIDVVGRKGDLVMAWCHLRNEERTFKRSRIGSIVPIRVGG
jgi:hypothetical protein